ncbi:hypothetical protein IWX48DRAFT_389692 [Phyllosticta citricarpa]
MPQATITHLSTAGVLQTTVSLPIQLEKPDRAVDNDGREPDTGHCKPEQSGQYLASIRSLAKPPLGRPSPHPTSAPPSQHGNSSAAQRKSVRRQSSPVHCGPRGKASIHRSASAGRRGGYGEQNCWLVGWMVGWMGQAGADARTHVGNKDRSRRRREGGFLWGMNGVSE